MPKFYPILIIIAIMALTGCPGKPDDAKRALTPAEQLAEYRACAVNLDAETEHMKDRVEALRSLGCWNAAELQNIDEVLSDLDVQSMSSPNLRGSAEIDSANNPEKLAEYGEELRVFQADYAYLIDSIALCRTKHLMSANTMSAAMHDDPGRTLLHAVGDEFGANTAYEGHFPEATLEHRQAVFDAMAEKAAGVQFIDTETMANPCEGQDLGELNLASRAQPDIPLEAWKLVQKQGALALKLTQAYSGDYQGFKHQFSTALLELEPEESFYFNAGWRMHNIVYQFSREESSDEDKKFTLRVFNSGEGIGAYAQSTFNGYQSQFFPFIERVGVSYHKLMRPVFLQGMRDIKLEQLGEKSPRDTYEKLFVALDGEPAAVTYDSDVFKKPQESGTCTYFPLPWVLDHSINQAQKNDAFVGHDHIPEQIEFFVGLATLRDYGELNDVTGLDDEEQRLSVFRRSLSMLFLWM